MSYCIFQSLFNLLEIKFLLSIINYLFSYDLLEKLYHNFSVINNQLFSYIPYIEFNKKDSFFLMVYLFLFLVTSPFFIFLINYQLSKNKNKTSLNLEQILSTSVIITIIIIMVRLIGPFLGIIIKSI